MPMACSGWRRSWLAPAKNCVLERVAASAALRAVSAALRAASAMRFSANSSRTRISLWIVLRTVSAMVRPKLRPKKSVNASTARTMAAPV